MGEIFLMRPLPDLTALNPSPSVFDQSTDDWNSIFAEDFAGMASQQQAADAQSSTIFPAMDPINAAIDALGGLLNDATDILGLLSGDLNTVDLTPEITNFQAADSALDAGLSDVVFDFSGAVTAFINFATLLGQEIISVIVGMFEATLNFIQSEIADLQFLINGTNPPSGASIT